MGNKPSFSTQVKNELIKHKVEKPECDKAKFNKVAFASPGFSTNIVPHTHGYKNENKCCKQAIVYAQSFGQSTKLSRNLEQGAEATGTYNIYIQQECCKRAYLKEMFLLSGSMSDPEKAYHLELLSAKADVADEIADMMREFSLNARVIERKNQYVVYLKEAEQIADFLQLTGAHLALMELENVRILKDVRNNVNRTVNCETANLEKTVTAAMHQIESIRRIVQHDGLSNLSDALRETAVLRMRHPELSLEELGQLFSKPIGKSGVYHRLKKLDEIAQHIGK